MIQLFYWNFDNFSRVVAAYTQIRSCVLSEKSNKNKNTHFKEIKVLCNDSLGALSDPHARLLAVILRTNKTGLAMPLISWHLNIWNRAWQQFRRSLLLLNEAIMKTAIRLWSFEIINYVITLIISHLHLSPLKESHSIYQNKKVVPVTDFGQISFNVLYHLSLNEINPK